MGKLIVGINDLATMYPELAKEWHPTKNGDKGPTDYSYGSNQHVRWLGKCGHEWEAAISSRTIGGNGCRYCANRAVLEGFNDLATKAPELVEEWDYELNGDDRPENIVYTSTHKVHWVCKECGHKWKAKVYERSLHGKGCKKCGNKRIAVKMQKRNLDNGNNSLEKKYPELAKEWHPTKNGDKKPGDYSYGSGEEVFWLGKCGHEWKAKIEHRSVRGYGCIYCSNNAVLEGFNDLATKAPALVEEWDYELNGEDRPENIVYTSTDKVHWVCKECGHKWKAKVYERAVKGTGCRKCADKLNAVRIHKKKLKNGANSLYEKYPELAKEWHPTKNGELTPYDITPHHHPDVYWVCPQCGFEYPASPHNRVGNKSGCPACSGNILIQGRNDLATVNPKLAEEWHPTMNGTLTPRDVTGKNNTQVYWLCRFGHSYRSRISDRAIKNTGCTVCKKNYKLSFAEECVFYYIRSHFSEAINSYTSELLDHKEIDIYIPSLQTGIEYDGQHYHKNIKRDLQKDDVCREHGINLIRIREPGCEEIKRKEFTIILKDLTEDELSKAIIRVLEYLGQKNADVDITRDKADLQAYYWSSEVMGSIKEKYPNLAKEWHPEKNGKLLPENIPAKKSKDAYWWKCSKCGHSWQALLAERINGTGCPVCSKRVIIAGINDLATTHPDIAEEWHHSDKEGLTPQNVTYGSQERVYWQCKKCGNIWPTRINRRVNGHKCPKCRAKETALKNRKAILQYTLQGVFIKEFSYVKEAEGELGIPAPGIAKACNPKSKNNVYRGFIWKYK